MGQFEQLWYNLPTNIEYPCDSKYTNQCAIRMSVALQKSGISVTSCRAVKCDFHLSTHKNPKHFLRAQELADWLKNSKTFGKTHEYSRSEISKSGYTQLFQNRKGIIFIQNGWGPTDHIDLWNGTVIKNGDTGYFSRGENVWFWEIS